jgi:glyoxylase-like metal-dependent hydrolase (beta-lactamase superfamily II)
MQIHTLDLNFQNKPNTIASYLVEGSAGPVLVETGPASTLGTLKRRLADHGYVPSDIRHILVTHIHFDHAGAAGWWAQQGTRIYVHRVGAPHLINPTRLLSSATLIYGDQMDTLWGQIIPAPAGQVTALHDGDTIQIGDLTFTALNTPGHAYHHHVYRLGNIAFTGDAAGIHLPNSSLVDLPAPPPEFNLKLWKKTIERLLEQSFSTIYPTHFGPHPDPEHQLRSLDELLDEAAEFVRKRLEDGLGRDEILVQYLDWHWARAESAGSDQEISDRYEAANPQFMSVDGIIRYWRKQSEKDDA